MVPVEEYGTGLSHVEEGYRIACFQGETYACRYCGVQVPLLHLGSHKRGLEKRAH